jgi:hypothetical protein
MVKLFRIAIIMIICVLTVSTIESCHRHGGAYNPYLHMRTKFSEQENNLNKKVLKKGNKAYKKKMGDSRKHLFERRSAQ